MVNTVRALEMLKSGNPDKRRKGCDDLRAADNLSQEAIDGLTNALGDSDPHVADMARRALAIHAPSMLNPPVQPDAEVDEGWPLQPPQIELHMDQVDLENEIATLDGHVHKLEGDLREAERRAASAKKQYTVGIVWILLGLLFMLLSEKAGALEGAAVLGGSLSFVIGIARSGPAKGGAEALNEQIAVARRRLGELRAHEYF